MQKPVLTYLQATYYKEVFGLTAQQVESLTGCTEKALQGLIRPSNRQLCHAMEELNIKRSEVARYLNITPQAVQNHLTRGDIVYKTNYEENA
jgi:hypothetical protein